jgi:hypothetical protein
VEARRIALILLATLGAGRAQEASGPAPSPVDFARDIQPLLRDHCLKCHNPQKKKGQFRVDSREAAFRGGVSGKVISPGNAKASRFFELLVTKSEDDRMPQSAPPLSPAQVELFRRWIDAGAVWPDDASAKDATITHWAYEKPVRKAPPAAGHPVDAFIAAAREAKGLRPRPEAPKAVLLRRLFLDLIGLPPTPEELKAFLADPAPDAYEKAVDRLLADPRHGERWGRHWMDVWRYSDWAGFGAEVRDSQPHIWRWRDWIVESLNAGKGYDRMVQEMLAGDELAPEDPDTVRATGFLVRNWYKFNRNSWLQATIEHTSKAFMGTTLNCARCHSHFFDPITQDEYYRFRAFFEPHQIRTDHVPGEFDTAKAGLARVFDADPNVPTHLFVRGNEATPDKSRSLEPGVPAALGKAPFSLAPVPLPRAAVQPQKRSFVLQLAIEAEAKAVAAARAKVGTAAEALAKAERALAAAPDDPKLQKAAADAQAALPVAAMDATIAEAKEAVLQSAIRAEQLEDDGKKDSDDWKKAAEAALGAHRRLQVAEATKNQFALRRLADAGKAASGKAAQAAAEKPEDAKLAEAAKKAAADFAAAKKKLDDAEKSLDKAEAELKLPPGTAYPKRKLPEYPSTSSGRRLALARWITHPDHPLAARVAVNHVWMRHFGEPLVKTVFDFGHNGRRPTHPELLDWLAVEFRESGWSLKKLHRLLVTSATYRMDSTADPAGLKADSENAWYWRMNSRRMEAEIVRDSVLYIAGDLDLARGGPELAHGLGLTTNRRSLYYQHAAEKQMQFLEVFDAANVNECYERSESVIPQQALALANSPLALEKSRLLARKLPAEGFVAAAFDRILGRPPTDEERRTCEEFLEKQAALLSNAKGLVAFAGGSPTRVPPSPDPKMRAREDLVLVLINHNEFVTIR